MTKFKLLGQITAIKMCSEEMKLNLWNLSRNQLQDLRLELRALMGTGKMALETIEEILKQGVE